VSGLRGRQRIEGVANGLLSMALVTHDKAQIETLARNRPIHVEDLMDDPLVVACGAKSEWAKELTSGRGPLGVADLAKFPLVLPEPDSGLREQLERKLGEAGHDRPFTVAIEVGGWAAILKYIEAGLGVGPLPRSVASRGKLLVSREAGPGLLPSNSVRLICRERHGGGGLDLTEMEQAFMGMLREAAKEPGHFA
jgi:DNA-binding transcriptional LysR family regulator